MQSLHTARSRTAKTKDFILDFDFGAKGVAVQSWCLNMFERSYLGSAGDAVDLFFDSKLNENLFAAVFR